MQELLKLFLIAAGNGDSRDWLALVIAAYGAVVATGVALYQFVRDRPGVKLLIVPVASEDGGGRLVERWMVRIVNHRQRPITINSVGVLVEKDAELHSPYVDVDGDPATLPLPRALTDGEQLTIFKKVTEMESAQVTGAWAKDALGRRHTVKYPSAAPRARWRAWSLNRRVKRRMKERARQSRT